MNRPQLQDRAPAVTPGGGLGLGLEPMMEWTTYLQALDDHRGGVNLPGRWVPSAFLVDDVAGAIAGRTSLRHKLNDFLEREGGQIGYGVLPSCRRRGYATKILRQSLEIARCTGIERVLVTCDDDNTGSITVIERSGGAGAVSSSVAHPNRFRAPRE